VCFPGINNGVYCCWFGGEPGAPAFDEGFSLVQSALRSLEERLAANKQAGGKGPYLLGTATPTLADVRVFPHLIRFDAIYHALMLRGQGLRIFGEATELPLLAEYVSTRLFGLPELRTTCDLQTATRFYLSDLPIEASDSVYDREREASGGWLPTRDALMAKREAEGLSEAQVDVPPKGTEGRM
jgi:glutathionyl-hydroquinone reductase